MRSLRHLLVPFLVAGLAMTGTATSQATPGVAPDSGGAALAPSAATSAAVAGDEVAQTYYRVLLQHTRWAESQWDAATGAYRLTDGGYAVVLGNAVLLTRGAYDADRAGVAESVLRERTLATIKHFAASNRLAGGSQWGKTLFWDTTFQSYFLLAAHLMWDELDDATRADIDEIARGQSAYTASLGSNQDPASGGWTTNGLAGGSNGDTKLEEMGVYAQSLAPGIAWAGDDPGADTWREWFGTWSRNEAGLPEADAANPTVVDGVPVSDNKARNIYNTFLAENHGSFGPHYQQEMWRTSGRNAIHFLMAGAELPEVLTAQPNGEEMWQTILSVMSDAGEPLMPMVNDREHLYGRDVIPLAFLAQVNADPDAARAEASLAERLEAYQAYPPTNRLTKFSGEPKYEPEARAEVAISYLLHEWRASTGQPVKVSSPAEFFAHASRTTDFGADAGLLAQQGPHAWAATVSKPGFTKFAWQPDHDDWLFEVGGRAPFLLPSTGQQVLNRTATAYTSVRDGFEGTASLLRTDAGFAGMTTLPTGTLVYATSGTGDGEGRIGVHNLTMSGVPGLDGDRSYATAEGVSVSTATDPGSVPASGIPGVARLDDVVFERTQARHVRVLGVRGAPTYGYSVIEMEVRDGTVGNNLAAGAAAAASSADTGRPASAAVDGSYATRWAVARAERLRADSWLSVDLGAQVPLDRVKVYWESAAGAAYRVQTSLDGQTWTDVASHGDLGVRSTGNWISVDDRAGLVVRGSSNPITVNSDRVVLSDGPTSGSGGMVVEGYTGAGADRTRDLARRQAVETSDPALRASDADGYLSLFNLSGVPVTGTVDLPDADLAQIAVFTGKQQVTTDGTRYQADLAAAAARLEPARFAIRSADGTALPTGLAVEVLDGAHVSLTAPDGPALRLRLTQAGTNEEQAVTLHRGGTRVVTAWRSGYPLADLALGRTTFPTSPLPSGSTDPDLAVDGDACTAWTPAPGGGRMVVDLGSTQPVSDLVLAWAPKRVPAATVQTSTDGLTYTDRGPVPRTGRISTLAIDAEARYVAVDLSAWDRQTSAGLVSLDVGRQGVDRGRGVASSKC